MLMKGQHDLARQKRLNEGRCPTHGAKLTVELEVVGRGPVTFGCPRGDCHFTIKPVKGTKAYEALMKK